MPNQQTITIGPGETFTRDYDFTERTDQIKDFGVFIDTANKLRVEGHLENLNTGDVNHDFGRKDILLWQFFEMPGETMRQNGCIIRFTLKNLSNKSITETIATRSQEGS